MEMSTTTVATKTTNKTETAELSNCNATVLVPTSSPSLSPSTAKAATAATLFTSTNLWFWSSDLFQFQRKLNQIVFLLAMPAIKFSARRTTSVVTAIMPVFMVLLMLQHLLLATEAGSCREAQLCCNGRDSSCVVQKAPINAIIEDLNDKPCYCDHACLKLGDCCNDFKDHCGVQQHSPLFVEAGSCRESQLCCNGRDSSCVVQKTPINAIAEDLNDKPCYCDHACLRLGDCCTDFKDYCEVLDCHVSDWGQWSDCNASCGAGTMTRTRKIIQNSQNGGKHCPTLVQKRGCQGFRCHGHHHDKKILRETALLLPAALSHRHHVNDSNSSSSSSSSNADKNHSTQVHLHHDNQSQNYNNNNNNNNNRQHHEEEYCVEFEVLRSSKACHKLPPYNLMIEGDRIVVRCDLEAFLPDFIDINKTIPERHHNTPSSLKAKQEMPYTSAAMDEEEPEESEENMIDNNSSSSSSAGSGNSDGIGGGGGGSSSSSSDEHDEYDTASLTMKITMGSSTTAASTTTTTTTTTTPYPPLQMKQYHCRGEGLPGRTTRWTALAAPSCRGKWLRLTLDTPKKCSHPQFAFV